jgi:predicted RNA-binding protein with PIN domain
LIRSKRLTGSHKNQITVVFDGYPEQQASQETFKDIKVIFSCDLEADEKIRILVETSPQPKNIVVVSDDKQIKFGVRLLGARVLGVEEFIGQDRKERSEPVDPPLNYSQMHKINQELRKLWLR